MKPALGQYIPGQSVLHRADPRTKIVMTVVFMVAVLLIRNFTGYALAIAFLIAAVSASKISPSYILKSIRPLLFIIVFTILLNLFFYRGETLLWEAWIFHIY